MMEKKNCCLAIITALLLIVTFVTVSADEVSPDNGRLSVQGAVGISGASGAYAEEYDARVEFSFNPGLRLRLNKIIAPAGIVLIDFGYLETGFVGYVAPTDSYFWNTYKYLNLNAMIGIGAEPVYVAAGLYFGIGLGANSYRGYTDQWIELDSNSDFGLIAEVGVDPVPFLSLGVQVRYGIPSIGTSVDIKNWGFLADIGFHFFKF